MLIVIRLLIVMIMIDRYIDSCTVVILDLYYKELLFIRKVLMTMMMMVAMDDDNGLL